MKILTGACYHSMDGKNRIRIPSKFKAELAKGDETLHFVQYSEGCVAVMNDAVLMQRFGKFDDIDPTDEAMLDAMRFLMGKIEDIVEDGQGRILLSKNMRDFIGVDKDHTELVTIGMINYVEIWRADKYQEKLDGMSISKAQKLVKANKEKQQAQ